MIIKVEGIRKKIDTIIKRKSNKLIIAISYIYLILPFIVFAIGWLGKRYWIPMIPILVYCCYKACKDSTDYWTPQMHKEEVLKMLFIILVICIWVYFSGIGKFVFQNTDHRCRNAIFDTLVLKEWPVINYDIDFSKFDEGVTATSLVYYIGFWLPSAVVGKIFGLSAGYGFQFFWAVLGIFLVYYFICARREKLVLWPLAILIFFSGMDIVGQHLRGQNIFAITNDVHIEWWVEPYQYSSMTTQLFWVFNQAIPAWLCTIFAYMQKNNRSLIFILACCMLSSTFPFVGLLVLVIFWMFNRKYEVRGAKRGFVKEYLYCWSKDTLTIQNILGGGIIGIFSFLYLTSNISGNKIMDVSMISANYENNLLKYITFIIVEIAVYFLLLYKAKHKDGLFYCILICLCIIPPIKVGMAGDFCMRTSIPSLFILMLFVMDGLEWAKKENEKAIYRGLIVALCIGAITPLHEFTRTFKETVDRVNSEQQVYSETLDFTTLLNSSNFAGVTDGSFFFKYIAK